MSDIDITSMEPGHFGVQVTEGTVTASARVRVPHDLLDDLAIFDVPAERVVAETIAFLLEREPATAIPGELSLHEVAARYPEYYDELRSRLAA